VKKAAAWLVFLALKVGIGSWLVMVGINFMHGVCACKDLHLKIINGL